MFKEEELKRTRGKRTAGDDDLADRS
jgi:hypothetical protein